MARLVPFAFVLLLTGCANYVSDAPPDSRIDVSDAYAEDALATASLAVVVGEVVVTDDAVSTHLGGAPEAAGATYRAFFARQLPTAFGTARVGRVEVVDAAALGLATARPADGARLDALDADFVLLLDTLHVRRATYYRETIPVQPGQAAGPPALRQTAEENLRIDTGIVLWDNRSGAEVAAGRLDTERELVFARSRAVYEDAVREFVEQLARFTPLALRE